MSHIEEDQVQLESGESFTTTQKNYINQQQQLNWDDRYKQYLCRQKMKGGRPAGYCTCSYSPVVKEPKECAECLDLHHSYCDVFEDEDEEYHYLNDMERYCSDCQIYRNNIRKLEGLSI